MIKKIISGGLPRVELAALDATIELGIPHEGWTYKSRKTENGILPEQQPVPKDWIIVQKMERLN